MGSAYTASQLVNHGKTALKVKGASHLPIPMQGTEAGNLAKAQRKTGQWKLGMSIIDLYDESADWDEPGVNKIQSHDGLSFLVTAAGCHIVKVRYIAINMTAMHENMIMPIVFLFLSGVFYAGL